MIEKETLIVDSYKIIRWLICDKAESKIIKSIQRKVRILQNRYKMDAENIIDSLFFVYQDREHYRKYSPRKGRLTTFLAHYVNKNLMNMLRTCDRRSKNELRVTIQQNYADRDDPPKAPEVLSYAARTNIFEPRTPEDYLLLKEVFEIMRKYLYEDDLEVLSGCVSLKEQAHRKGLDYEVYQKTLYRKKRALQFKLKEEGW